MDSLTTLCNDARDRFELKPESPAEGDIVEGFNSHLKRLKNRYHSDRFIQSIPWIGGEINNRHIYLRIRNLQGALLTAGDPDSNTELESNDWRERADVGLRETVAAL